MATRRKTTTVKTGPNSRRTTTISSKGTRITNSNKPPGAATRRTVSTSLTTGKTRITHTTKNGGGWITSRSKTFGGTKYKPSKSKSLGLSVATSAGGFLDILMNLVFGIFMYVVGFIALTLLFILFFPY
jgi:hypothetical protein